MIRTNLWVLKFDDRKSWNFGDSMQAGIIWSQPARLKLCDLCFHPPYHQKVLNLQGGRELLTRCWVCYIFSLVTLLFGYCS